MRDQEQRGENRHPLVEMKQHIQPEWPLNPFQPGGEHELQGEDGEPGERQVLSDCVNKTMVGWRTQQRDQRQRREHNGRSSATKISGENPIAA